MATARAELRQIATFIADRDTAASQRLKDAVEACAERVAEHPFLYRPGRIPGTREAVVHPNYILVYRVGIDAVEILNVAQARQQYP